VNQHYQTPGSNISRRLRPCPPPASLPQPLPIPGRHTQRRSIEMLRHLVQPNAALRDCLVVAGQGCYRAPTGVLPSRTGVSPAATNPRARERRGTGHGTYKDAWRGRAVRGISPVPPVQQRCPSLTHLSPISYESAICLYQSPSQPHHLHFSSPTLSHLLSHTCSYICSNNCLVTSASSTSSPRIIYSTPTNIKHFKWAETDTTKRPHPSYTLRLKLNPNHQQHNQPTITSFKPSTMGRDGYN
jgi:hypothetical protein